MDDWPTNQERAQQLLAHADEVEWETRSYKLAEELRAEAARLLEQPISQQKAEDMTDHTTLKEAAEALSGHNWYVLGPPWAGFTETFTILRDSPDPHVGEAILETIPIESMDEDDDHYRQRDLANWLELCDPSKVLELLAENEALREALAFYADGGSRELDHG